MNAADRFAAAIGILTTTGRTSGVARSIDIWFAERDGTIYLLSGGGDRSNWVRNIAVEPAVTFTIAGRTYHGRARVVVDPVEDEAARDAVAGKYQPSYGGDLSSWRASALPIAIDLDPES